MDANRPWQFVAKNQKRGRTGRPAEIFPTPVNKRYESSSAKTYLQSTVGGASLVDPGRGNTITVTWDAPTTARRRPFGFNTSSWIWNWRFGVHRV